MNDPIKPYNDLPLLPPAYDFDQVDILKQVNLSNIALASFNAVAMKLPNPWLLARPLLVRESVASSGIENINTTVQEVFEAELFPERRTGPAKEVLRYREAVFRGMDFIRNRDILTINDIIAIQEVIEPNKPGIRKIPGTRIMNSATKEVLYTPPEGETLLRDLLANLERYINTRGDGVGSILLEFKRIAFRKAKVVQNECYPEEHHHSPWTSRIPSDTDRRVLYRVRAL
jgi:Fic family protein